MTSEYERNQAKNAYELAARHSDDIKVLAEALQVIISELKHLVRSGSGTYHVEDAENKVDKLLYRD